MKRKRSYYLSLLALIMILCAFIQPAWAYFTSTTQAEGAIPISFGNITEINETVTGLKKEVTISNSPDSLDYVWVRAQAYVGAGYEDYLSYDGSSDIWVKNGDWWYYTKPLAPAPGTEEYPSSTAQLVVELKGVPVPEGEDLPTINVVVVYQSTPAFYNADGSFGSYDEVDWNVALLSEGSTSGS